MVQSFTIMGRLPGMNDFAGKKSRWSYAAMKKETEYLILAAIHSVQLKPMPYAYVSCHWVERDTKRDPDNICAGLKFALDTLVYKKILPGDGWAHVLGIAHSFSVDKEEPRVEITLTTKGQS
jgi:hypothetical protein